MFSKFYFKEIHKISNLFSKPKKTGRLGAIFFDDLRGMDQTGRLDRLFDSKTCVGVLSSVDKTNAYVNYFCIFLTLVLTVVVCFALQHAFAGLGGDGQECHFQFEDRQPSAPPMPAGQGACPGMCFFWQRLFYLDFEF